MESQIWLFPACCVALWGRAQERQNGLCLPFCLRESCLPALTPMSDTLVPPCIPLVPFKLLLWWYWSSEGVHLSKLGTGTLRGTYRESSSFFTDSNPTVFYSQKLWGLIFLALKPWAGGPGVRLVPFTPKIFLLNFYPPHMAVGPTCTTHPYLHIPKSPTFLDWCDFFSSVVVTLIFNSISDGSESSLVCNLVVILMWLCEKASHVYLYLHLDQKSWNFHTFKKIHIWLPCHLKKETQLLFIRFYW